MSTVAPPVQPRSRATTRGGHKHPCNCAEVCLPANSAYDRHRRRQIAYGRWEPFTAAAPVREHVRSLMAAGIGTPRIAELSGVQEARVLYLLYGQPHRGYPPPQRIRTTTARQLLALKPAAELLAGGAVVDATGTRRRVQALVALGWSERHIAAQMPVSYSHLAKVIQGTHEVTARTAAKARAVYDRLWDQAPPETTRGERIVAARSRARAARSDWPPPLAWDDDEIDDPAASPHPWKRGKLRDCAGTAEDVTELLERGYTRGEAAERLGLKRTTLDHALTRAASPPKGRRAA